MFAAATMTDSIAAHGAPASNHGSARAEPFDRDSTRVFCHRPPPGDGEQKESS
jgi:hypothetical protein